MNRPSLLSTPVGRLRLIAMTEGVSFLLLLFIAMPLKYLAGMPLAVKYTGWAHGVLFVAFGLALLDVMVNVNWPLRRSAMVFIASLVPFGPFLIDRRIRESELER